MSPRLMLAAALLLAAASPAVAGSWTRLPSAPLPAGTAAERGRIAFEARCAICHGADPDAAGTASLKVKYGASKPARLEQRTDLTPETIRYFVRHGSGMMPFLRKTELSDAELEDLAAYLARAR